MTRRGPGFSLALTPTAASPPGACALPHHFVWGVRHRELFVSANDVFGQLWITFFDMDTQDFLPFMRRSWIIYKEC